MADEPTGEGFAMAEKTVIELELNGSELADLFRYGEVNIETGSLILRLKAEDIPLVDRLAYAQRMLETAEFNLADE